MTPDWYDNYLADVQGRPQFEPEPLPTPAELGQFTQPAYYADPEVVTRREFEAWVASQQEPEPEYSEEELQAYAAAVDSYLEERGFAPAERDMVVSRAGALARLGNGELDLDGAAEDLQASRWQRDATDYLTGPPEGEDGKPASHSDRVEWMTAKLQAEERARLDLQRAEGNEDRAWVREGRQPEGRDEILAAGAERMQHEQRYGVGEAVPTPGGFGTIGAVVNGGQ